MDNEKFKQAIELKNRIEELGRLKKEYEEL